MNLLADFQTAELDYREAYLPRSTADGLFDTLMTELDWREMDIVLYGRQLTQPRLVAWYADPGVSYAYSGLQLDNQPLTTTLDGLRNRLQQDLGERFNSVLANLYRDGSDSMGWHADDERELGEKPVIASISLGETRRFLWRPKEKGTGRRRSASIDLAHGSLLLMRGESQASFQHSVPKTSRACGPRINLTFRWVLAQAPN